MSDNLNIKRPLDATKVNVNESWELEYWSQKFGVSIAKLKEAVSKVGVLVSDVKKYLGK
jgi:hypothetical protein